VTPHNEEVAISLLFFQNVESTFMGFVRNFTCMIVVSNILKDMCGFLFFFKQTYLRKLCANSKM
jgi:hypothetical protein